MTADFYQMNYENDFFFKADEFHILFVIGLIERIDIIPENNPGD